MQITPAWHFSKDKKKPREPPRGNQPNPSTYPPPGNPGNGYYLKPAYITAVASFKFSKTKSVSFFRSIKIIESLLTFPDNICFDNSFNNSR